MSSANIVTANNDGTLTMIAQKGADEYEFLGNVTTRTEARMMFMDERNGNLYLVTADSTTSVPDAIYYVLWTRAKPSS